MSDALRVDRQELLGHVERIWAGVRESPRESYRTTTGRSVKELAQIAQAAPPVRLLH